MYRPLFVEVDVEDIKRSETPAGFCHHHDTRTLGRKLDEVRADMARLAIEMAAARTAPLESFMFRRSDGTKIHVRL